MLRTWHGQPELPEYVRIVHGNRTDDFDLPELTRDADGLLMVGFHGLPPDYAFGHAYRFRYMILNDRKIGEITIQVLLAATRGVPTIFMAGDEGAIDEVRTLSPDVVAVRARAGLAPDEGPMSEDVLGEIRKNAACAATGAGGIAVPSLPRHYRFGAVMRDPRAAEIAQQLPYDVRRDGQVVSIETDDFSVVYSFLLRLFDACDEAKRQA